MMPDIVGVDNDVIDVSMRENQHQASLMLVFAH
jgi:hypothetical protein